MSADQHPEAASSAVQLRAYRPLNYDPYDPGDEWPDDVPGLMRVHVIQERARRLAQANSRDELRAWLRERGEPVGGRKHDLAFRIVNHAQELSSAPPPADHKRQPMSEMSAGAPTPGDWVALGDLLNGIGDRYEVEARVRQMLGLDADAEVGYFRLVRR